MYDKRQSYRCEQVSCQPTNKSPKTPPSNTDIGYWFNTDFQLRLGSDISQCHKKKTRRWNGNRIMPNNLITSQLFRNATIVSDNAKTPSYSVSDQCEKIPSLVPIPRTWRKCPHRRHYHVDNIISTPGITKTSRKIPSSMKQDTLLCFAKPWGPEEENLFITRGMSKVYTHPSFCHEVFDSNCSNNKARLDRTRRRVIQSRDVSPRQPMRTTPKAIDVALDYLAHDLNMYENTMTEVHTGIPQLS